MRLSGEGDVHPAIYEYSLMISDELNTATPQISPQGRTKCLLQVSFKSPSGRSPEQIRTADFQLRRLTFYPAELREQNHKSTIIVG